MLNKQLIGIKECADYLGITVATLYSWVHVRKIPHIKMCRLVKFDLYKIDEWVKEREVPVHSVWLK